ncbi:hypothetical protein Ocin01_07084, partial [Orchesella cincta]
CVAYSHSTITSVSVNSQLRKKKMKWGHKSKVIALLCLSLAVNAQNYYQGGFQPSAWPSGAPYVSSTMFEPQKAASFPLNHYSSQSHDMYNPQRYTNSMPNQPQYPNYNTAASQEQPVAAVYSGYYYVQDKEPQQPHRTPNHIASTPHFSNLNSYYHQQQHQPFASPSYHHPRPAMPPPSPFPPQTRFPTAHPSLASPANSETYREAVDLFSEVVKKLEKETGVLQPGSRYLLAPVPLPNGIPGSTSAPASGFPHQLDHIMGPEFLQRAQKLYGKIIKEQTERLRQPPAHHPQQGYPGAYNRNDYMRQAYHNSRPSHFARNMIVDSVNPSSSLVDTVKALELNVPESRVEQRNELMQTAESSFIPINSPTKAADEIKTETELIFRSEQDRAAYGKKMAPKSNDYVEHPLPYEEYEGLIKDIL